MAKTDARGMQWGGTGPSDSVDIIFPSTFMKREENNSTHKLARMLQANSKFDFIYYFHNLHLQIIESISLKASVENSPTQWAILIF